MSEARTEPRRLPPPPWAVVGSVLWDMAFDFAWFWGLSRGRR